MRDWQEVKKCAISWHSRIAIIDAENGIPRSQSAGRRRLPPRCIVPAASVVPMVATKRPAFINTRQRGFSNFLGLTSKSHVSALRGVALV
jgi:hypothetical protein